MTDYVKACCEVTASRIAWLLELEQRPSTLNGHYYADYRDKFLASYRAYRETDTSGPLIDKLKGYRPFQGTTLNGKSRVATVPSDFQESMTKVFSGLSEIGMTGIQAMDLPKLLPPDLYDPALHIMATVRAYFQGQYKALQGWNRGYPADRNSSCLQALCGLRSDGD